jgi:hypothetical protein
MTLKLPRTIRLDASDDFAFDVAATPGEWAVPGAFAFLDADPRTLTGKRRQAFRNGFLGLDSLGWSTLVTVAEVTAEMRDAVVEALAQRFVFRFGAPDLDAARPVARDEVAFAMSLCEHPVNTILAVERSADEDGGIRESFRVIEPPRTVDGQAPHAAIWAVETAEEPDIVRIATGGRLG